MKLIAAAALGLCCGSAFAAKATGSDVRAFYASEDFEIDGEGIDGDGFGFGANLVLPLGGVSLYVPVEYTDSELDFDIDLESLRAGVGVLVPVGPVSSFNAGIRYQDYELGIEGEEIGLDGYALFVGGKAGITPMASVYGELNYQALEDDIFNEDVDGFELSIGLSANFGGPGVFAEYRMSRLEDDEDGELDLDGIRLGVSFSF